MNNSAKSGRNSRSPTSGSETAHRSDGGAVPADQSLRDEVVQREKEKFGGLKFGAAFFGWLAATGAVVLITALLATIVAAIGLNGTDLGLVADQTAQNVDTIGVVSAIVLAVVIFIAYFGGGYVAGRMARFSGALQGLGVWLWALLFAIVIAITAAVAGSALDDVNMQGANAFPQLPIAEGELATGSIITAVIIALVSLGGAILGGITGMRFHRRVDEAGLGHRPNDRHTSRPTEGHERNYA